MSHLTLIIASFGLSFASILARDKTFTKAAQVSAKIVQATQQRINRIRFMLRVVVMLGCFLAFVDNL